MNITNTWIKDLSKYSLEDLKSLYQFFGINFDSSLSVLIDRLSKTVNKGELTGVKELDFDILLKLSDPDLASACQTDKEAAEICNNDYFWKLKFKNKYGFTIDEEDHKKLYRELNHKTPNELLIYGVEQGEIEIVKYAISHGADDFNDGLYHACRGGRIEIAKLMIKHGADDFNQGLAGACGRGQIEAAELMIKHGADEFNEGLSSACGNGQFEAAELMIKHGADDFNDGLYSACYGGQIETAKLMIQKGATNFDLGLMGAGYGGKLELAKLMIKYGATPEGANNGLRALCDQNHMDLVELLIKHGGDPKKCPKLYSIFK